MRPERTRRRGQVHRDHRPKDYGKNIEQFAQDGYDVIVTVGFALGDATIDAAKKYPNIKFIGVDQFQAEHARPIWPG